MRAVVLSLLMSVAARADLAIVLPRLLLSEDGAPAIAGHLFREGDTIHVTFQLGGYERTSDEDAPKVSLTYRIEVFDPKGVPVVPSHSGKVEGVLAPEDKNWQPKVRYKFTLPESTPPGTYEVRMNVRDEVSGDEASTRLTFAVAGETSEAASTLTVQGFRYVRPGDPRNAITSIRAGEPFEARFQFAGYKLGERNNYNVRYGLSFVNDSGKAIFGDPNASANAGESFYPRLYVPVTLSMKLDENVRPGRYRLQIKAEDLVGGQATDVEFPIQVNP